MSVAEGIRKTVELGVGVVAKKLGVLDRIVPVLGFDGPPQRLESLDLYKEHGATPQRFRLWGVGGICMMKSPRMVERVLSAVGKALGGAKIHVFGISMNEEGLYADRCLRLLGQGRRRRLGAEQARLHPPPS